MLLHVATAAASCMNRHTRTRSAPQRSAAQHGVRGTMRRLDATPAPPPVCRFLWHRPSALAQCQQGADVDRCAAARSDAQPPSSGAASRDAHTTHAHPQPLLCDAKQLSQQQASRPLHSAGQHRQQQVPHSVRDAGQLAQQQQKQQQVPQPLHSTGPESRAPCPRPLCPPPIMFVNNTLGETKAEQKRLDQLGQQRQEVVAALQRGRAASCFAAGRGCVDGTGQWLRPRPPPAMICQDRPRYAAGGHQHQQCIVAAATAGEGARRARFLAHRSGAAPQAPTRATRRPRSPSDSSSGHAGHARTGAGGAGGGSRGSSSGSSSESSSNSYFCSGKHAGGRPTTGEKLQQASTGRCNKCSSYDMATGFYGGEKCSSMLGV